MTNALLHMLCLKQQLYSFRIVELKSLVDQLTKFNKIIHDLQNNEVKLDVEDKILLLLSLLPRSLSILRMHSFM